jgi:hypothetical protein
MNITSGSHHDFLNFQVRDNKNVTCTLVSDAAGMSHGLRLQCFNCEVHKGGVVQCCQFGTVEHHSFVLSLYMTDQHTSALFPNTRCNDMRSKSSHLAIISALLCTYVSIWEILITFMWRAPTPQCVHTHFVAPSPGYGESVTDFWGWGTHRVQLRFSNDVSDDIYVYEHGVPAGALNLNSTSYPDHGCYGDLPLQGKIPTAEPGIEPGISWLVVRSSDHQATRLAPLGEEWSGKSGASYCLSLSVLLQIIRYHEI